MRKLIGLSAFFSLYCSSVYAANLADLYLSKSFWQNVQWGEVSGSQLWKASGWRDYEGEQNASTTFEKTQPLNFSGFKFTANLARLNDPLLDFPHFATFTGETTQGCQTIIKRVSEAFGKPSELDASMAVPLGNNDFHFLVAKNYQWNLGSTRIQGMCFGNASEIGGNRREDETPFWSLRFGHQSQTRKIEPKILLSCTQTINFDGDDKPRPVRDLIVWIDVFSSRASFANHVVYSDKGTFQATESEIRFSATNKDLRTDHVINRLSGSLNSILNKNGKRMGRITGTCEKSDVLTRKF